MSFASKFDFNFNGDKSDKFIAFIFGFLMFVVTISIISGVFTYNITKEWSDSLNGHVTIEFQSVANGADETFTEKQSTEILQVLKTFPGVISVKKLNDSDILKILEPWLSGTAIPDDFPFPAIYDIEIDKNQNVNLLLLSEQLSAISHNVKIHNHADWYAPLSKISTGLILFAFALSCMIFIAVCATVIFITRKTLNIHKDIVRILQLIGASNEYIALQFKKYYFLLAKKSAFISLFISLLSIYGFIHITSGNILNHDNITYLAISFVVPLISIFVIVLTSRRTVIYFLKNNEWLIKNAD